MSNLEEYLAIVTTIQFILTIINMKAINKLKAFSYNKVVTTASLGTAVLDAVSGSMPTIIEQVRTAIASDLDLVVDGLNEHTAALNEIGLTLGTEIVSTVVDPSVPV